MPEEKVSTCPSCGYTKQDAQFNGDHRLCKNAGNAPWEKKTSRPPAADAGPRPSDTCGEPAASFIPRWGMYFTCVLPKGHEGEHKQGGTCFKHGEYVGEKCPKWPDCSAPVPQEAAPAACPKCGKPKFGPWSTICTAEIGKVNEYYCQCMEVFEATAPDSAMRVAERLGTCRTPHFLGDPTPDRKALTQIPHHELPQGLCRDWQAIDRVAATKEPQSKGQDGSTDSMQTNTAPIYMCPAGCGCLWRDNQDGTMSLYGPNSKSCEKCEPMSLGELTPLIREAGSHERKHPPSNELLWKISRELPEQLQPMYCSMTPVPLDEIRSLISSALQDVANDEYAQAYEFFSRAGEAGSERERELREVLEEAVGLLTSIAENRRCPEYVTSSCKSFVLRASRLLGGESK